MTSHRLFRLDRAVSTRPNREKSIIRGKAMRVGFLYLSIGGLLTSCVTPPEALITDPVMGAAVTESTNATSAGDRIKADVYYLADDAREGREAGTRGHEEAALYVAARMEAIGLKPGNDGGWFQQVRLRAATPVTDVGSLTITKASGETVSLTNLEDFRVSSSLVAETSEVSAPAVFVGFGVSAPEDGHDDYAGLDVKGKIVVYFSGAPSSFDSEKRAHYGGGGAKAREAADRGAVGIVSLFTAAAEKRFPWDRFVSNPSRPRMTWVGPDGLADVSGQGIKSSATIKSSSAQHLFEGAVKTFDAVRAEVDAEGGASKGFDLAVSVSIKGAIEIEDVISPNVVGVIPGTDRNLRDEFVVLSAHLDHIGINQKLIDEGKDGINNGAMDNALGVSIMLEVARRFIEDEPPARSVIILAVTAEEKGLLGSDYFAHFPTVPIENIVANVNLDMPVMLHSFNDVVAFGAEHSTLGPITESAVAAGGALLSPDPIPEQGIFTRSDHYRFVEKGVPSVFLWPGFGNGGEETFNDFFKNHYHRPSDDMSLPVLYDDVARFADINYKIAHEIANTAERPHWNEGDFFGDLFAGE